MVSTTGSDPSVAVDLVSLRRRLRASWALILGAAVVGGVLGGLWAGQSPGNYAADATVAVGPSYVAGNEGLTTTNVNTATERQVALSAAVIEPMLPTAGGSETVGGFRQRAAVATPPDSTTLILTVEGSSGELAAEEVRAWADAYMGYRTSAAQAAVEDAVGRLDAAIEEAQVDLARATRRAAASSRGTVSQQTAAAERSLALAEVTNLQAKRTALATATPPQDRLLGSPQVPSSPEGIGSLAWVLIGLILGALAGMLLALVRRTEGGALDEHEVPDDISAHVAVDLTTGSSLVEQEIAALIARTKGLPGVREHGVTLGSGTPGGQVFAAELAAAGQRQGMDVVTTTDLSQVDHDAGPDSRPLVLVTAAEGRDPWLPALAPSTVACLLLAEPGRSQLATLRSLVRTVTDAGSRPWVVLLDADVLAEVATPTGGDRPGSKRTAQR